jgi:hypothetical protein
MEVSVISWISLAMAIVLSIERICKRIKHCESGCCKLEMEKDVKI